MLDDLELEPAETLELEVTYEGEVVPLETTAVGTVFDDDAVPEDLPIVSLATAPGDGAVGMDVGAYGEWGRSLLSAMPGQQWDGNAYFDPVGPMESIRTTWHSLLHLRHPGQLSVWVTSEDVDALVREGGLPRPGFLRYGPTSAESVFLTGDATVVAEGKYWRQP